MEVAAFLRAEEPNAARPPRTGRGLRPTRLSAELRPEEEAPLRRRREALLPRRRRRRRRHPRPPPARRRLPARRRHLTARLHGPIVFLFRRLLAAEAPGPAGVVLPGVGVVLRGGEAAAGVAGVHRVVAAGGVSGGAGAGADERGDRTVVADRGPRGGEAAAAAGGVLQLNVALLLLADGHHGADARAVLRAPPCGRGPELRSVLRLGGGGGRQLGAEVALEGDGRWGVVRVGGDDGRPRVTGDVADGGKAWGGDGRGAGGGEGGEGGAGGGLHLGEQSGSARAPRLDGHRCKLARGELVVVELRKVRPLRQQHAHLWHDRPTASASRSLRGCCYESDNTRTVGERDGGRSRAVFPQ
eukprot:1195774-Prorocentrum_minimum.AAC.4